jgi:hypothetical protein
MASFWTNEHWIIAKPRGVAGVLDEVLDPRNQLASVDWSQHAQALADSTLLTDARGGVPAADWCLALLAEVLLRETKDATKAKDYESKAAYLFDAARPAIQGSPALDPYRRLFPPEAERRPASLRAWLEGMRRDLRTIYLPVAIPLDGNKIGGGVVKATVSRIELAEPREADEPIRVFFSPLSTSVLPPDNTRALQRCIVENRNSLFDDSEGLDFLVELEPTHLPQSASPIIEGRSPFLALILAMWSIFRGVVLRRSALTGEVDNKGTILGVGYVLEKGDALDEAVKNKLIADDETILPYFSPVKSGSKNWTYLRHQHLPATIIELLADKWTYFTDGFEPLRTRYAGERTKWENLIGAPGELKLSTDAAGGPPSVAAPIPPGSARSGPPPSAEDKEREAYVQYFSDCVDAAFILESSPKRGFHSFPCYVGDDPAIIARYVVSKVYSTKLGALFGKIAPEDLPIPVPLWIDKLANDGMNRAANGSARCLAISIEKGIQKLVIGNTAIGDPLNKTGDSVHRQLFLEGLLGTNPEKLILVAFGPCTELISKQATSSFIDIAPWMSGCIQQILDALRNLASTERADQGIGGAIFVASDAHHDEWIRSLWKGETEKTSSEASTHEKADDDGSRTEGSDFTG